ncbi:CDP-glucose 4,6-dehydratase [Micromonospora sp. HUAS YX12]|uniref:CDP-glucose 4,6-dehydratase n=1 Tax=Micromonospora sp. HUAS YX12 TaxID=3156396 RepID=A0AAU7R2W7_9ACTN
MVDTSLTTAATPAAFPWRDQQVLVTGHSGFVGSWLSAALCRLGARVTGFGLDADRHTKARAHDLAALGAKCVVGDIRDFAAVDDVMATADFDAVFHLAAQPLVPVGQRDPHGTLTTNILGSVNVLEAARRKRAGVVVHVTSDKCYRNRGWIWPYREADELGGGCPYSVSKAAAELVFEAYHEAGRRTPDSRPRTASTRFGNVIGGGDHAASRLVPDTMAALRAGIPVELRNPDAVRPWQHVLDVVHGLLRLAERLSDGRVGSGEVFNFAPPGDGASVEALVRALGAAWHGGQGSLPVVLRRDDRIVEDTVLRLDGRKAAAALDWRHHFDIHTASAAIVAWQRGVDAGRSPIAATTKQIDEFLGAAGYPRLERNGIA